MLFALSLFLVVFPGLRANEPPEARERDDSKVCYPSVGCFSNLPPWSSPNRPALPPQHPLNVSTSMYFYNRDTPDGVIFSIFPEVNLTDVPYDKNKRTIVIFPCFMANATLPWVQALKNSILLQTDANVFIANTICMKGGSYKQWIGDARVLGKMAQQVIESVGVDPSLVHLIGHCVGSQTASYAAKFLGEMGKKPARLTALDPSGPMFEGQDSMIRLSSDDAGLVDVHHTDIKWAGMASAVGHVDFYFNGGLQQPGCEPSQPNVVATCSHIIAHDYYVEAVGNGCMVGLPAKLDKTGIPRIVRQMTPSQSCQDVVCLPVVLDIEKYPARGVFLVYTNPRSPYCNSTERNIKIAPY